MVTEANRRVLLSQRETETQMQRASQELLALHQRGDHGGMLLLGVCVTCEELVVPLRRHNITVTRINEILSEEG